MIPPSFLTLLIYATPALSQFTLSAFAPSTPLHGLVLNAAGSGFYTGLEAPATLCPLPDQASCPDGTETVFAGMIGLMVEVPGGQQIYVATDGTIGYTAPHSAATPPGAYIGGFTNVTVVNSCAEYIGTVFNWKAPDNSTGGILACPVANSTSTQIFAKTSGFKEVGCTELVGLLPDERPAGTYGAWEYT